MKKRSVNSIIAAVGMLAALPAVWAAPADTATPVRGQVTAVDATAKTVTLQDQRSQTTTVVHVTDATKYLVDVTGALSDVKAGQTVRVTGQTTGTTITARMIQVVPPEEASLPSGGRRRGVQGVVAGLTPSLTITTDDKQTDTVQTDTTTRVTTSHPGTLTDVKPQANVTALTTGTGASTVATMIHVRLAGGYGGGRPAGGAAPATP